MPNSTTVRRPPWAFSQANSTSDSHSQANHGSPGLENEKMSRVGTRVVRKNPFAGPDVPAGIAIAEQRLHSVHAAE